MVYDVGARHVVPHVMPVDAFVGAGFVYLAQSLGYRNSGSSSPQNVLLIEKTRPFRLMVIRQIAAKTRPILVLLSFKTNLPTVSFLSRLFSRLRYNSS
jgi:hypothetical protein